MKIQNLMQALLSEKIKKLKKIIFLPCKKNSAKRVMFVRGIGAAPSLPHGVCYVSFGNRRHMGARRKKS